MPTRAASATSAKNPFTNTSVGKGWDKALGITGMPEDLGAFPQISPW